MKPLLESALALLLAGLPLAAQVAPTHAPGAGNLARALNLTDTQRASIRTIREKHRPDLLLRRDAARQSRLALRTALRDGGTPEARLRSLYDQASAARFEWMLARRSMRQEVRAVFSPEQRERAAELRGMARQRTREEFRRRRGAESLGG